MQGVVVFCDKYHATLFRMSPKTMIGLGATVGSTLGSYVPTLWGGSGISTAAVIFTLLGGILGIYLGYKIAQNL